MTFTHFEAWLKRNKATSILLIILFISGLVTQTTDIYERMISVFYPVRYPVIDIHFDNTIVSADALEEGFAGGNSLFSLTLNPQGSMQLFNMIENAPNDIYLIRLSGTSPIDEQWLGGASDSRRFSLQLIGGYYDRIEDDGLVPTKIKRLHFPSTDDMSGWSSFSDSPSTCCENYFRLIGFYRFVYFREKQDIYDQYKMQLVEPNSDIASATLEDVLHDLHLNTFVEKKE